MTIEKATSAYRHSSVETAPPGELVLILLNEAVKDVRGAMASIDDADVISANSRFLKAQAIVDELCSSLNLDAGKEIALHLQGMYRFVYDSLVAANVKKDKAPAQDALRVLAEIRDGWRDLIEKSP